MIYLIAAEMVMRTSAATLTVAAATAFAVAVAATFVDTAADSSTLVGYRLFTGHMIRMAIFADPLRISAITFATLTVSMTP